MTHHNTMTQSNKPSGEYMKIILITLLSLFISAPAMAGPGNDDGHGHSHSQGPVSSNEAIKRATKKVIQMAKAGKIDSLWSTTKASAAEQKTYAKGPEWVITFNNDKISDTTKQTLYMFFSQIGRASGRERV